jgi:GxxExxY protein
MFCAILIAQNKGSRRCEVSINDDLTEKIISCCYNVYNELGSGFLEIVYANSLEIEFLNHSLEFQRECKIEVYYKGELVGNFQSDFLVENQVIIELKSVSKVLSEHKAQLINYLKASKMKTGLLINFGTNPLEIKRLYT